MEIRVGHFRRRAWSLSMLWALLYVSLFAVAAKGQHQSIPILCNLSPHDTGFAFRQQICPRPVIYNATADIRKRVLAEKAIARVDILTQAGSAKAALEVHGKRSNDTISMIKSLPRGNQNATAARAIYREFRRQGDDHDLDNEAENDDTEIEGRPVKVLQAYRVDFPQSEVAHRLAHAIKDDHDVNVMQMVWEVDWEIVVAQVTEMIESDFVGSLMTSAQDEATKRGLTIVGMDTLSSKADVESDYTIDDDEQKAFDFHDKDSIREFFDRDPGTSGSRIPYITLVLHAQVTAYAVTTIPNDRQRPVHCQLDTRLPNELSTFDNDVWQ